MRALLGLVIATILVAGGTSLRADDTSWHGLTFQTLTLERAEKKGLIIVEGAEITEIAPTSPAISLLQPGDVIIVAKRKRIATAKDLKAALDGVKVNKSVALVRVRELTNKRVTITRKSTSPAPAEDRTAALSNSTLMLDTGGHMATMQEVIFTPDGKQLISAGDDKLIRIWDTTTGKTVRTIRGELAPGDPGKLYTMALSPDGRWLAAAGWTEDKHVAPCCGDIRVYDFASGTLVKLLRGHESAVLAMTFSPDGRKILSGTFDSSSHGKTGIIWTAPTDDNGVADWSRARLSQKLKGHSRDINAVAFTPDSKRALTGAYDNSIRVWDVATGRHLATLEGHGEKIGAVAVSHGGTIVSGDSSGEVRIWSSPDVYRARNGETVRANRILFKARNEVATLVFSPDGSRLLVTLAAARGPWPTHIIDIVSGKDIKPANAPNAYARASAWSPDGQWIAMGDGVAHAIHIWSPETGKFKTDANGNPLRMRGGGRPVWATGISGNSQWIGWGNRWRESSPMDRGPVQYALRLPSRTHSLTDPVLVGSPGVPTQWKRATAKLGNWTMKRRRGGRFGGYAFLDIIEGGRVKATVKRTSTSGYQHRAMSVAPDGKQFISGGGNGELVAYTKDGKSLGNFVGHESDVWTVTPSPDGRFLISGAHDQTVRIWNIKTRELIATLFHAPAADGTVGDWVIWTPQGFYTGSPNAGRLVGWQLNNGADKTADYVIGGQFRVLLNRRDIIEESLRLASAKAAVAKMEPNHDLARVLAARPPVVSLVTPEPYSEEFRGSTNVTVFVQPGSAPVKRYDVTVNGIKVPTVAGSVPVNHPRPPEGQTVQSFNVPLADGRNVIEIVAISAAGESQAIRVPINHNGEGPLDKRGKLHIVAVGVDNYQGLGPTCGSGGDETCNLNFAGKDARLFADTISKQLGGRHAFGVRMRLLTNKGRRSTLPTAENILAALDDLAKSDETDTVAVFLAGHGERGKDGKYYFLPTDIARSGGFDAVGTGRNIIEWSEIQKRLTAAKGRRMLFVDACQSGAVGATRAYNGRLLEDAQYESFVAFMASGPNQAAIERPDIGQGLFTHALAQGIRGGALEPGQSVVRVLDLGSYVAKNVFRLSNGRQRPVYTPHADFVLAAR